MTRASDVRRCRSYLRVAAVPGRVCSPSWPRLRGTRPTSRGTTTRASRPTFAAPDPRSMGGGSCEANAYNCADTPNPLPTTDTVWLEEMTWMDVRDALSAGKTTAIIATGGIAYALD